MRHCEPSDMSRSRQNPARRRLSLPLSVCVGVALQSFLLGFPLVNAAQISEHHVDVLPFVLTPPTPDIESLPTASKGVFDSFRVPAAPIIPFDALQQTLVFETIEVDAMFSFSFMPEVGRNISDYDIGIECSNHAVLVSDDVALAPPVIMEDGRANFTANVIFERAVGVTDLSIVFLRKDKTVYANIAVHYIICGISFFYVDMETGKKMLVQDNQFSAESYDKLLKENIVSFYTYAQFPDGSSTESVLGDRKRQPDMSGIKVSITGQGLIAKQNFESCLQEHASRSKNGSALLEEGCSFGFTSESDSRHLYFLVEILKYRTGVVVFTFRWDDLLRGTVIEDGYETVLRIRVVGEAPPAVVAVSPPGPFSKGGGQLFNCSVINSWPNETYHLVIGNTSLPTSATDTSSEGWTVLSFITPPGEGKNVPWSLSFTATGSSQRVPCPWAGTGGRYVFNYFDEDIEITSLSPSFGPVKGGTQISCDGYFGNFSLAGDSGDTILLGPYALQKKYIVSVTATRIVFTLPAMNVVQSPTHDVGCVVFVHGIRSNEVIFSYESLTEASISLTGGSYDAQQDIFLIPFCNSSLLTTGLSVTLLADVNKGAPVKRLKFQWRVVEVETRAEVLNFSSNAHGQSLALGISRLSIGVKYEALVVISDGLFKTELSTSVKLQLTSLRMLGVGLSVDQSRTIALPPVETRISATVSEVGGCYGRNHRLSYDWTFNSITKTLSSSTEKVDIQIAGPRRLGREYLVPRHTLKYGKHKISVKVYYTDEPGTYGIASAFLNVEPAILQAIIGSGESRIQVSDASDLEMDAGRSYDPDTASSHALIYNWDCELSTEGEAKFTTVAPCPAVLLPSAQQERFVVSSSALQTIRFIHRKKSYVRYSLHVRKSYVDIGLRSSARASQVIEVFSSKETMTARGTVAISTKDGYPVHLDNVPFYETLVLSPHGPTGSAWRFRLTEPASQVFTFLSNPDNVLQLPGYYNPTDLLAGRKSLGIAAGALKPNSLYTFEVQYESSNADSPSSVEVSFRTMPRPAVTFLPLSRSSGTPDTLFTAVAVSSVQNYAFKYYYSIEMEGGTEMCIDGCSGLRKVSFRVPMPGKHTIRCTMVDARGHYVIARANQTHNLTINAASELTANDSAVLKQSEMLQQSFDLGDHSAFEVESLHLAMYAKKVSSDDARRAEMAAELVSKTVDKLAGMFFKTQPNTALARDYMQLTLAFASLTPGGETLGNAEAFYAVCRMMYYTVQHVPLSERFNFDDTLAETLRLLFIHAQQLQAGGTSRIRLTASYRAEDEFDVNEQLLEVGEVLVPLLTRVTTRAGACGSSATISVGDVATVHTGVFCNAEQGTGVHGRHASLTACDGVFGSGGSRRVAFGLGEIADYVQQSRVLTRRRQDGAEAVVDRDGSVALQTRNMPNHGFKLVKTIVADADSGNARGMTRRTGGDRCFMVVQDVRATAAVFDEFEEVVCGREQAVRYVDSKVFGEGLGHGAYEEHGLQSVTLGGRDNGVRSDGVVRVSAMVDDVHEGLFGVKRAKCVDVRPRVLGVGGGIAVGGLAAVGVFVAVVALGLLGLRQGRDETAVFADGDAPYIERDVYGRDVGAVDGGLTVDREMAADGAGAAAEADGEEVVFESPRVRGQPKVSELFGER